MGSTSWSFKAERGVRQEDALSPFLFTIVADAFSYLISKVMENLFKGLKVKEEVEVFLLQYADADDTILCGIK